MKTKHIKHFVTLMALLLLSVSCQENEEYTPPNEFRDARWLLSGTENDQLRNRNVSINNYITFFDFSVSPLSHTWSIESGNSFLKQKIDVLAKDFTPYIDHSLSTTNKHYYANVLFTKPGISKVVLTNTFATYVENNLNLPIQKSVKNGDSWLYQDTFNIDVYDHLKAIGSVEYQGVTTNLNLESIDLNNKDTWPVIEVEAGEPVTFKSASLGRPNSGTWTIEGASPKVNKGLETVVSFATIAEHSDITLEVQRVVTSLEDSTDTTIVPVKINVVLPTKPLAINTEVVTDASAKINFGFNGSIAQFNADVTNFTVTISNSNQGVLKDASIKSVALNSTKTGIVVTLDEPIYADDEVAISYIPGADLSIITDVYSRTLSAFNNVAIVKNNPEINQQIFEFENVEGWTTHRKSKTVISFNEHPTDSKGLSLKFSSLQMNKENKNINIYTKKMPSVFNVPATTFDGVYQLSFALRLEKNSVGEDTTLSEINLNFAGPVQKFKIKELSGYQTGVWHTINVAVPSFPTLTDNSRLTILLSNKAVTSDALFYMDDLKITWLNRP